MKTFIFFTLIVSICSTSFAQIQQTDQDVLKGYIGQKAKRLQQVLKIEQQQTKNQEMFDVKYYSLDLVPNPSTEQLTGSVEIVCNVLSISLDSIELDFWDGMTISDIHLSEITDNQLRFSHNNDILSVDLDSTFQQGEKIALTVKYMGSPQNSDYRSFAFSSYNGNPMIWTLSEPWGARAWWPCKDIPSDKADSVDIRITVPKELIVASNGTLKETNTVGDTTTYWWHEQYPISTYLVSLAIHPYTVYYDDYIYNNDADTMKIHFYMFPDHVDQIYESNSKTKEMISCFSNLFGEYPFINDKYGLAELVGSDLGFIAMEHQTCTSMNYSYFIDSPYYTELILSHELAHQWWGDLVTCENYNHIWINEGFATYSEALWREYLGGPNTASEYMMYFYLYLGPGTIFVENPTDFESIFDYNLSFKKSAWVLHMLRHTVTDSIFFDILKTYGSSPQHKYGAATTEDFRAICEHVSGMNLQKFFQQWIYEEYYPFYEYSWTSNPDSNGYKIDLVIEQVQQNRVAQGAKIFWMPIDLQIKTSDYDTTFVVWDSLESQSFEFVLDEEPTTIELDPNNWILKEAEITGIAKNTDFFPSKFALYQNFPNPFNAKTVVSYQLPVSSDVNLSIYNIVGQKVSTLVSERQPVGSYKVEWNASSFASGVYFYKLETDKGFAQSRKLVLLK